MPLSTVLLSLLLVVPTDRQTVSGWVSDAACASEHTKPGGERCVRLCLQGGGTAHPEWKPQKMVLVADADHAIWIIENPAALAGLEGKHVTAEIEKRDRGGIVVYSAVIKEESNERH